MERSEIIKRIKSKTTTIDLFNYDTLSAPPLLSLLTYEDIEYFRRLATSIKYSSKIDFKYSEIDRVMKMRRFVKLGGGTNRVVYRHLEIDTIVVKIAIDAVGIKDNPREYENQFYLKPYVTKVFEVSPCGTVGLFERCDQITSREEFQSVASEVFDLLSNWIIGKYIMEDIGSKYFMNYCIRPGFGPVLCDFPYLYELDGNKLYCRVPNEYGILCDGTIDYDKGFNNLYCSKCGAKYKAIELKKAIDNKLIISKEKESIKMKLNLNIGDKTLKVIDTTKESRKYEPKRMRTYRAIKQNNPVDSVRITTSLQQKEKTVTTVLEEIVDAVEYTVENEKDDFEKLSNCDNEINTIESEESNESVDVVEPLPKTLLEYIQQRNIKNKDNIVEVEIPEEVVEVEANNEDKDILEVYNEIDGDPNIDNEMKKLININCYDFIESMKEEFQEEFNKDILIDLTISLRTRQGKNICVEDYIDTEDDQEESEDNLTEVVNDTEGEINDSDDILEDQYEDPDCSYDDEDGNDDVDNEENKEEYNCNISSSFIPEDIDNDIPVGAVPPNYNKKK